VAATADLNNALMEASIKELEKLETQFQRYDDILTALTNARRIVTAAQGDGGLLRGACAESGSDISALPKRKLEISKQRLALASLTNGNVGDSPPPGNDTPKTG
jgi:hypothetical protein